MAKNDFLVTPMDYTSGGTSAGGGEMNGDPNFPKRSAFGPGGVPEKTLENWPTSKSPAEGSPVVEAVINKDNSIT